MCICMYVSMGSEWCCNLWIESIEKFRIYTVVFSKKMISCCSNCLNRNCVLTNPHASDREDAQPLGFYQPAPVNILHYHREYFLPHVGTNVQITAFSVLKDRFSFQAEGLS